MKAFRVMLIGAILAAVPLASLAATKKKVEILDPTAVGNVVLQPGEYQIEWDGSGPQVQVSFVKGKKTVVTAPARVQNQPTGYDQALGLDTRAGSNTKVLKTIDFKDMSLLFDTSITSGGQ